MQRIQATRSVQNPEAKPESRIIEREGLRIHALGGHFFPLTDADRVARWVEGQLEIGGRA